MARPHAIFQTTEDGLHLAVRAKPATSKERALRLVDVGDGAFALEITVNAMAQDGKANKALRERIAVLFGVSKSSVTLKSGDKARLKLFHISGNPALLLAKAQALLGPL